MGNGVSKHSVEADSDDSLYMRRGVSASKPDVKAAIKDLDAGLFPNAFCKAVPDSLTGSSDHCLLTHSDGAGTKSALAYIQYKRHGDPSVFKGIAQDSTVMNLDDLLCVGACGPFIYSNTIGRNLRNVPGEVVKAVIDGYEEFAATLRPFGIELLSCGGETADLGDLVRTLIVDSCLTTRMRRDEFINCAHVRPGHVIVGLASAGTASYERGENSGIGTNGFTALRHGLFTPRYKAEFPETFAPEIEDVAYSGPFDIDDALPGTSMTIGEACLSPTRTYAPVIAQVLKEHRRSVSAMFHNTGGGQTKCAPFGNDVRFVKDNLFPLPPLFQLVLDVGELTPREMLQVFNLGHRYEVVCDARVADDVIAIAHSFNIEARIVGRVESAPGRSLAVHWQGEVFEFAG